MKLLQFNGYSESALDFLRQLKDNNNKAWFDENRKTYEKELREPSKALVSIMSQKFAENELPYIGDLKKSMFRINRDIRFSKNKDPYKTNIGLIFPYGVQEITKKATLNPGLYFHLEIDGSFIGGGIHCPPPPELKSIRNGIAENYEEFDEIVKSKKLNAEYDQILLGDKLKSMPRGFYKEHPAAELLKLKDFTAFQSIPLDLVKSTDLIDVLLAKGEALIDFNGFIKDSMDQEHVS